jgi:hypothetical protein
MKLRALCRFHGAASGPASLSPIDLSAYSFRALFSANQKSALLLFVETEKQSRPHDDNGVGVLPSATLDSIVTLYRHHDIHR